MEVIPQPEEIKPEEKKLELRDWLECVLPMTLRFDRDEMEECIVLIRDHFKSQPVEELTVNGPCLSCTLWISYDPLSSSHKRYGESWYRRLCRNHKTHGLRYKMDHHKHFSSAVYVEGSGQFQKFQQYFCAKCTASLKEVFARKYREFRIQDQQRRVREESSYAAARAEREAYRESLKQMPYKEFLKSEHWLKVRVSALKRARYKCELCHAQAVLHVHHKTYEHRGWEDHYLDDLIVLCWSCHGKFHGKIAPDPVEVYAAHG